MLLSGHDGSSTVGDDLEEEEEWREGEKNKNREEEKRSE